MSAHVFVDQNAVAIVDNPEAGGVVELLKDLGLPTAASIVTSLVRSESLLIRFEKTRVWQDADMDGMGRGNGQESRVR